MTAADVAAWHREAAAAARARADGWREYGRVFGTNAVRRAHFTACAVENEREAKAHEAMAATVLAAAQPYHRTVAFTQRRRAPFLALGA